MDLIPSDNALYGTREYWDARYTKETSYDWLKSYDQISALLKEIIQDKTAKILNLGCGNSALSDGLWDDGFKDIVNIDFSPIVISKMTQKNIETRPSMQWLEMDIRRLFFADSTFDIVIDKATMDSMMTDKGDPWNVSENVVQNVTAEVDEVIRVLKPSGVFVYFSFGQPHFRRKFLTRDGCTLEVRDLGGTFSYYCYIMQKKPIVQ